MPDDQRRVVGPLHVVEDEDGRGGRGELVYQPHQHLDAGNRRVAVREQPLPEAAEQVGGVRAPRVRRTRPHLKAVQHHAQWQPLGELACNPPSDVPPRGAACRQGLGDQGRLADAGFALDPDHRPFTSPEGLDTGTEDREFLPAAHPLRRPVNGPHASNVCPARSPPHLAATIKIFGAPGPVARITVIWWRLGYRVSDRDETARPWGWVTSRWPWPAALA